MRSLVTSQKYIYCFAMLLVLIWYVAPLEAQTTLNLASTKASTGADIDIAEVGRPALRFFTDDDGLPQNSITSIGIDRKGYLWAGTQDGAAYYNGNRWTVVNMPNQQESNQINAILVSADNSIFFGTLGGGICRLKDGKWTIIDTSSGLPNNRVRALLETTDADGTTTLWAGTDSGLAYRRDGRWQVINRDKGLPENRVRALQQTRAKDGSTTLWIGTYGGGLAALHNDRWQIYDIKNGLPGNEVWSLLAKTDERGEPLLWVGTSAGLGHFSKGNWQSYDISNGLPDNQVRTIMETRTRDGKSTIWLGTGNGGLVCWRDNYRKVFDTASGFPAVRIYCLLETISDAGNSTIWIGTISGLARLEERFWVKYDTQLGLPSNQVFSFLETQNEDRSRAYWIGTQAGIARFDRGRWTITDRKSGLPSNGVTCMLETRSADGRSIIWLGSSGGGFASYENGNWRSYDASDDLPTTAVLSLLETEADNGERILWLGTRDGGLIARRQNRWQVYDSLPALRNAIVYSLIETRVNNRRTLWAATNNGLAALENGNWRLYDVSAGLPNNIVYSIAPGSNRDGHQVIWVGTIGGLVSIDLENPDKQWQIFNTRSKPALPNNVIYQIREDANHRVYVFTGKGIARLTPRNPTADDDAIYNVYTYTTEDGLPSNECNSGASMIDSKGRIWVGTVMGAAMFDPAKEIEDRSAKKLYLEQALLTDEARSFSSNATLRYHENNISFEYALLSYTSESRTRYQSQLLNFDKSPSEWTSKNKREYTNLGEGDYIFRVWGRDYAGNVSGPVEIKFRIKAAPWRTWWAYGVYLCSLGGIVYLVVMLRLRRMERNTLELKKIVAERTAEVVQQRDEIEEKNRRILDSIHYAERIQQAMLPHQERIAAAFSEYFILFKPKDIVSGDFYWFHELDDQIILAVADCTGHGVPGAFMSMIGNSLLSQIIVEKRITDPATILANLHRGIRHALKQNDLETESQDGMDIALCRIDKINRRLIFAGAKRPFYYIDQTNSLVMVKGDRRSIGGKQREAQRSFTNYEIPYRDSLTFYLTTDGFTDQNGNEPLKFGSARLKQLLQETSKNSMQAQHQALLEVFNDFKGSEPQRDDITIIGVRIV